MIAASDLRRLAPRLAAFALVSAIAAMAAARFVGEIVDALGADPGRFAWLALAVPLGAAVAAMARWAPLDRPSPSLLAGLLALHVLLRVGAIALFPAPVTSDWARYDALARDILGSGPQLDVVPTGYPMLLAVAYAVGGATQATGQALQVVLGALVGLVVYALGAAAWNHRVAAIGLLLLAVAPSQILIGTVLASEPLYTLLTGLAALVLVRGPRPAMAAVAGAVLGLSQYVRATSLALVPVLAWLAWRWQPSAPAEPGRRRWTVPAALVAAFVAVLVPVAAWNLGELGVPSLSTSRVQNFSLLVGLNQETDGRFGVEDFALVGSEYGTREAETRAGDTLRERVGGDPIGTIGLMLRKVWAWGDEDYGAFWAAGVVDAQGLGWAIGVLLSQAWWAIVTVLAALAVAGTPVHNRLTQLTLASIVIVGAVHLVLEAQGRYHSYLVPLVAILAAAAVGTRLRLPSGAGKRPSAPPAKGPRSPSRW